MLGRVLNGRYLIKEKVGAGGMSEVYLADDLSLVRPVAVKVLHPEFARDPGYIQRFRYEAQAAANLNHPNIVNVYDWGSEGDAYYIVMEYVEGRELKDLLREQGRFTPERAAEVAAEIAAALQLAHRRNLVHRDIKPQNVIITPTGQVKVMDFGIARAASGTGMTQTGVVMGTAQYIAPEQAQGLSVDGRADIYSLGIVLYEMLTGRVPFDDENPLAVAYRQVRDDPVPPSALVPGISPAMEAIVMKALAKNPANRYQTAQELKADLLRFLEGMPVSATPLMPAAPPVATAAAPPVATAAAPPVTPAVLPPPRKKVPAWAWALAGTLLALGIIGIVLAVALAGKQPMVDVPNLINKSEAEAKSALEAVGLKMEVKEEQYITKEGEAADVVVAQDPEGGKRIAKGKAVSVVITRELRVPELLGLSSAEAVSRLSEHGLKAEIRKKSTKKDSEVDVVLSQSPSKGTLTTPGNTVTIEVGALLSKISVPNVKGKTADEAASLLADKNLTVNRVDQPSESVKIGYVIDQSPASGSSVYEGDTVTIFVSTGTEVPDVIGLKESDAKSAINSRGLSPKVIYQSAIDPTDPQIGRVVNQSPAALTMVEPGSEVTITVKKAP